MTNATPTVKINSTKDSRNDSANSIDGDTAETPAVERHEGTVRVRKPVGIMTHRLRTRIIQH